VGRLKYLVAQGTFRSPVNICVQGGKWPSPWCTERSSRQCICDRGSRQLIQPIGQMTKNEIENFHMRSNSSDHCSMQS
jgi:hypothetical protein